MKLTRIVTGFLAVALLAVVVTDAYGQDDGRRRGGDRGGPGGGFGGRGGPGGGPGGGFGGGPGGGQTQDPSLLLLRIQEVRDELELLPDQEDALKKMNEQADANRQRPDFDFRNASEAERTAFFEKMQKQAKERVEQSKAQLEEILLPEQMDRLKQLAVQAMGMQALSNEEVAKKLEITSSQKEKLEEVSTRMRDQIMQMFRSGDRENVRERMEEMREKVEEMRKGIESDLLNVLTAGQKKEFEEMKGEPFEFPEGAMRRGGFGGGPGGGPGGGRGGPGGGDRGGPGGGRPGGDRQRPAAE